MVGVPGAAALTGVPTVLTVVGVVRVAGRAVAGVLAALAMVAYRRRGRCSVDRLLWRVVVSHSVPLVVGIDDAVPGGGEVDLTAGRVRVMAAAAAEI
jgi:hypothetical protein